ncbi:hemerythrin domain-containing protein [Thomasclavelia sp.]|uniref:hemerythrin domain-containing protein n=1 Tax=Thomasclavelia sp. TaxID=3025757 RepID=UPI0026013877|nr:hemerythrin domain-containing protein [Thomasclavelia sp.]
MTDIITDLEADHQKILAFINEFEQRLIKFMEENIIDFKQMADDILFIREFADKHHHQREEKILFKYMIDHLGTVAKNLVQQGMMVEHDLARLYVKQLKETLQSYQQTHLLIDKLTIISTGHSYCMLLRRHIEKEDTVVYPFARKNLSAEIFKLMNQENQNY